jgi:hypothetical protein
VRDSEVELTRPVDEASAVLNVRIASMYGLMLKLFEALLLGRAGEVNARFLKHSHFVE